MQTKAEYRVETDEPAPPAPGEWLCKCRNALGVVFVIRDQEILREQDGHIHVGQSYIPCPVCGAGRWWHYRRPPKRERGDVPGFLKDSAERRKALDAFVVESGELVRQMVEEARRK